MMMEWKTLIKQAIKECREREQQVRTERKRWERLLKLLPDIERRPFALLTELEKLEEKLTVTDTQALTLLREQACQKAQEQLARYSELLRSALSGAEVEGRLSEGYRINYFVEVRIDEQKRQARIGTRFHMKRLTGDISVEAVAEAVRAELKRLFERPFDPDAFLYDLFHAYQLALVMKGQSPHIGEVVPIFTVHKFVVFLSQKNRVFQSGDASAFQPYLPDEFAVDIGKLLESEKTELQGYRLHLHPIRNPKEALFIVNFAKGIGQNYGLISFNPIG